MTDMLIRSNSLGARLEETAYRPTGFDYMRVILSVMVVVFHTWSIVLPADELARVLPNWYMRPFLLILPMFFALSGFLVAGSLERNSDLKVFFGLRLLRLWPALSVEIILSALIIGPIFTWMTLSQYFSDPKFSYYFLNLLGHPQYELPGVFENNIRPRTVNSQLWTLPFELYSYIFLALASAIGAYRRGWPLVPAVVVLQLVTFVLAYYKNPWSHGLNLVVAFIFGMILYRYRYRLPYNRSVFIVMLAVSIGLLGVRGGDYFGVFATSYVTVWLGLGSPRKNAFVASGDYSYGIFLYGYPIQQAVAFFGPWSWLGHLTVSLPIIVVAAWFSWWLVEKPALRLRPLFQPRQKVRSVSEASQIR